jgi:hypothetical protein
VAIAGHGAVFCFTELAHAVGVRSEMMPSASKKARKFLGLSGTEMGAASGQPQVTPARCV